MKLRRDINFGVGLLIFINLLIAFGAIGLFTRMSPAIELILEENVQSIEAVEEMLVILGEAGGMPVDEATAGRFVAEFDLARSNITETDEIPIVEKLEEQYRGALAGDPEALAATIRTLADLGNVNRDAMQRADERAKRLGAAGAWATVFFATIALMVGLVVLRRLKTRLLGPLEEIGAAIDAVAAGDVHRRAGNMEATDELRRLQDAVNELLDHRYAKRRYSRL